jgi:hypothetical protein
MAHIAASLLAKLPAPASAYMAPRRVALQLSLLRTDYENSILRSDINSRSIYGFVLVVQQPSATPWF